MVAAGGGGGLSWNGIYPEEAFAWKGFGSTWSQPERNAAPAFKNKREIGFFKKVYI